MLSCFLFQLSIKKETITTLESQLSELRHKHSEYGDHISKQEEQIRELNIELSNAGANSENLNSKVR